MADFPQHVAALMGDLLVNVATQAARIDALTEALVATQAALADAQAQLQALRPPDSGVPDPEAPCP